MLIDLFHFIIAVMIYCPIAVRPDEFDVGQDLTTLNSGQSNAASQDLEYIKPKETTLELKRTFPKPGIEYILILHSYNMHNEDDFADLTWKIQCANPIVPDDWELDYKPFLHSDTAFNMSLKIKKEKVLLNVIVVFSPQIIYIRLYIFISFK